MSRSRNWCVTTWKEPTIEHPIPKEYGITFYIYKKEICPETKKDHWHLYIELNSTKSMRQIKDYLKDDSVHCEPRRGTQEQAIDYVIKAESKAGEPVVWGERKRQGKRSDIDEIFLDLHNGATLRQVLINHQGNALRIIHAVERTAQILHNLNMTDWIIRQHQRENWTHPEDEEINEMAIEGIEQFQNANALNNNLLDN